MKGTAAPLEHRNTKMPGALVLALPLCCAGCVVSFNDWPDPKSSSGGAPSSGGGPSATGGVDSTTGGAGGAATTSGAGAGGLGTPRIVWLTFENDQAKSTASPNDSLGINGLVFAYNDGCAQYTFDSTTRCASGRTCAVDTGVYANWGMAVEFDFVVDGTNVKHTWNPSDHSVIGFAWQITNTYGTTLQLWLPEMDPAYAGTCSADTCSLNAPPYGAGKIGVSGGVYLSAMTQDSWGGGYPAYAFSSANFYSLQFKIPTVVIQNAVTFDFCIDRLGVIVFE